MAILALVAMIGSVADGSLPDFELRAALVTVAKVYRSSSLQKRESLVFFDTRFNNLEKRCLLISGANESSASVESLKFSMNFLRRAKVVVQLNPAFYGVPAKEVKPEQYAFIVRAYDGATIGKASWDGVLYRV